MARINQQKISPYLFISPFFILFAIFGLFPIFYSIYISFFKWTTAGPQKFLGFGNYTKLLTTDPFFKKSILTTIILLFTGTLTQHVFAFPLAILLNQKFVKGRKFFRTSYFLPYVTSSVSIALIFYVLFDKNFGLLNHILEALFQVQDRIGWLKHPTAIKASVSVVLNWRYVGFYTIIYLAGLQSIPEELYEAARIDGANVFRQSCSITLPMMIPVLFFALSISIIYGMQLFDECYLLTGQYTRLGGPDNAAFTTTFYIMTLGFRFGRFGKGSATSWLLFVFILALTFATRSITNRFDYTRNKK